MGKRFEKSKEKSIVQEEESDNLPGCLLLFCYGVLETLYKVYMHH